MQAGNKILADMAKKLSAVCDNPEQEARLIFCAVAKRDPRIPSKEALSDEQIKRMTEMIDKRLERIPLQYILGEWEFMGISLKVGEGVLCPRPDSECVAEYAIEFLKNTHSPAVLDLCAGTGALGLAIKRFVPSCEVTAVELYREAFHYLDQNAAGTINTVLADLHDYHSRLESESVTLIICNPPYIPKEEGNLLEPELSHEPPSALFEPSPLYFYHKVSELYYSKIVSGGCLVFEIATNTEQAVADILRQCGFSTEMIFDYNHTVRGVAGIKK